MQAAFGPADLEQCAAVSFAVFGVQPGGVDAGGAPQGTQAIGEVIGAAAHGGGGRPPVQRLWLLPTPMVPTVRSCAEPCW